MKSCHVARLLGYISGLVNQELLLQVEYLAAENRILRAHLPGRLRLSNVPLADSKVTEIMVTCPHFPHTRLSEIL